MNIYFHLKKIQNYIISQKNRNIIQENNDSDDSNDSSNKVNGIKININKIFNFSNNNKPLLNHYYCEIHKKVYIVDSNL
jgi:hypothetical protein